MTTVITTVGTSMYRNCLEKNQSIKNNFEKIQKKAFAERDNYNEELKELKGVLTDFLSSGIDSCAELQSLDAIKKEYGGITVVLIATDTIASWFAATLIKEYLQKQDVTAAFSNEYVIVDLQVEDAEVFQSTGLNNLFRVLGRITERSANAEIMLNITGGYKGLIPYMAVFAQLERRPLCYIFEETNALITIQPLPLEFDYAVAESYSFELSSPWLASDQRKDTLILLGLMRPNGKLTAVGEYLKRSILERMPSSKGNLGYFAEYKLLEYYLENPCSGYPVIRRSVHIAEQNKSGAEIDLVMLQEGTKPKKGKPNICVAVKSMLEVSKGDHFLSQLQNQLNLLTAKEIVPNEYHLITTTSSWGDYKVDLNGSKLPPQPASVRKNLLLAKHSISKVFPASQVKFYYIHINLKPLGHKNPVSDFMQNKLSSKTFKEITIQE